MPLMGSSITAKTTLFGYDITATLHPQPVCLQCNSKLVTGVVLCCGAIQSTASPPLVHQPTSTSPQCM